MTVNYKEVLQPKTVEFIEEGEYDLDDALKFIDEYNEDAFVGYYEEYVRTGESVFQKNFQWFLNFQGNAIPFFSGMRLN